MNGRAPSTRAERAAAWALIALSVAAIAGLDYAMIVKYDRWTALPFALLAHAVILPAVAACGLTWRMPRSPVRVVSRVLAVIVLTAWLHTWFGPLQKLAAWISIQWYLWMGT